MRRRSEGRTHDLPDFSSRWLQHPRGEFHRRMVGQTAGNTKDQTPSRDHLHAMSDSFALQYVSCHSGTGNRRRGNTGPVPLRSRTPARVRARRGSARTRQLSVLCRRTATHVTDRSSKPLATDFTEFRPNHADTWKQLSSASSTSFASRKRLLRKEMFGLRRSLRSGIRKDGYGNGKQQGTAGGRQTRVSAAVGGTHSFASRRSCIGPLQNLQR